MLNWALRHENILGKWRYISTHSLTSALDGGEWSASRPGRFTPKERTPGTHWKGGWVGPRAVLDAVVKRKILSLRRESNPRTPIVQPVAQHHTDWAVTAPGTHNALSEISLFVYFRSFDNYIILCIRSYYLYESCIYVMAYHSLTGWVSCILRCAVMFFVIGVIILTSNKWSTTFIVYRIWNEDQVFTFNWKLKC
jgi:hypothetical protein